MALDIFVDEHAMEYERKGDGESIGTAIDRSASEGGITLRPRDPSDEVTLNGKPAKYSTILRPDHSDATIEVDTNAYKNERARKDERTPGPLRQKVRKKA